MSIEPRLTIPTACIAHATAAIRSHVGPGAGMLKCEGCDNTNAARQRQNTAYADDERNWVTLCPDCMKENDEQWRERWAEYYAGCL